MGTNTLDITQKIYCIIMESCYNYSTLLCYRYNLIGVLHTIHLGPVDMGQMQWFYPPATSLTNGELHVLRFLALDKIGVIQ
jgi:hypothetical protein